MYAGGGGSAKALTTSGYRRSNSRRPDMKMINSGARGQLPLFRCLSVVLVSKLDLREQLKLGDRVVEVKR